MSLSPTDLHVDTESGWFTHLEKKYIMYISHTIF